jgi:hypothetical protein
MKKNIVLLFAFFILSIFFSLSVFAQERGCCYSETECITNAEETDCTEEGYEFLEGDDWCVVPEQCVRGCCCLDSGGIPTTEAFCLSEGEEYTFYPHEDWTSASYLETYSIYGPNFENSAICEDECSSGYSNCEFKNCELNDFTETEMCYCSDGSLADASNPYCCLMTGQVYSTYEDCNTACSAEEQIYGTIYKRLDRDSPTDPLYFSGATISTAGKTTTSDGSGYYSIENVQNSGYLTVSGDGYLPKTIYYDIEQDGNEINVILDASSLSCSGSDTRPCTITIQGCDTERVCEDGVFSECRIIEETCPSDETVCGNNIWETGETCEVVNGVHRGCNENEMCVDCNSCVAPMMCGNYILEPENNEECDPDRTDPQVFYNTVEEQCGSEYAINCTTDCKCVYEEPICGDGKITYGEQCDWETNISTTVDSLCTASNCGYIGEATECLCSFINRNSCGDGYISGSETCEEGVNTCPNGEACIDCQCNSTQIYGAVLAIDDITNNEVTLSWTVSSTEKLENFYLYRCNVDNDNECLPGKTFLFPSIENTERTYLDNTLEEDNTNYCYWLDSVYNLTQGTETASSNKVCLNSGFEFCEDDTTTEFCMDNIRMHCNNTQIYTSVDDPGWNCSIRTDYVCIRDSQTSTRCVYKVDCDACNGDFDSFYIDKTILDENDEEISCSEAEGCYLDSTPTTVDRYYSCYDANSCYDYMSEGACDEDKCGIGNCIWEYSDIYGDVGVGICRPTETSLQNCKRCEDPDNIIFGECNRDICSLYGDCYFDEGLNYNNYMMEGFGCIPYSEMSCDYYDFREDCGSDIEIETVWNSEYTYKEGDTNEITEPSSDLIGLGTCKWIEWQEDEFTCAKDADNNTVTNLRLDGGIVPGKFDCPMDNFTCQRDNTPPITTILYRDVVPRRLDLDYVVYDDNYDMRYINTYYCFKPKDALPCYPNKLAHNGIIIDDVSENPYPSYTGEGYYDLYYFSEDYSHNLEKVKKVTFYIDTSVPEVNLNYILDSDEPDPVNFPNEWRTNLSINFNVSKNATCSAYLEDSMGEVNYDSGLHGAYGDSFDVRYNYLEDDTYTLILVCEDNVGNINDPSYYIIPIDADSSIYDPQPNSTVSSGENLDISVKTNRTATCKYSLTETEYEDMENAFDSSVVDEGYGQYQYHYSTVDVPGRGIKIINVKCLFDDSGKVYGNKADRIKFAIDKTPPTTYRVNEYNVSYEDDYLDEWKRSADFYLLCKDSPIYENNNQYSKDWAFGCDSLYYGLNREPEKKYVNRYNINLTMPGIYTINYYSEDKGGNKETTKTDQVKVDNVNYGFYIYITDIISGQAVDKVTVNKWYTVSVGSTKVFDVNYDQNYHIDVDSLSFNVNRKTVPVGPSSEYITADKLWEGQFSLTEDLFSDIESYEAKFNIHGIDSHGIESYSIIFGGNFTVDTNPPAKPIFDPALTDYPLYDYPLHHYNGIYYTDDPFLYVSANYSEQKTNVSFVLERATQTHPERTYFRYDQGNNGAPLYSKNLYQDAERFDNEINVTGEARTPFEAGNFIGIEGYQREDYGFYKQFYEIAAVDEPVVIDGQAEKTKIILLYGLEQNISEGTKVTVYDGSHPEGWAGTYLYMNSSQLGKRKLSVLVTDEAGNTNVDSATIYLDNIAPVIEGEKSFEPKDGFSVSDDRTNISIIVREQGSGLDLSITNFTIKGLYTNSSYSSFVNDTYNCDYNLNHDEDGDNVCYKLTFVPDHELMNDLYRAYLEVYDLAHNVDEDSWYFYIETGAPNTPEFRLKNAPQPNPDSNGIWYIQQTPEFTLDFSDPEPINLTYVTLTNESGFEINDSGIDCDQTGNFFDCSFNKELSEQEYRIDLSAYKTLDDGNISPPGRWNFYFTIDNTPPEFTVESYPNPTKSGIDIDFKINVLNEQGEYSGKLHDLLGYFNMSEIPERQGMNYSVLEIEYQEPEHYFTIPKEFEWPLEKEVQNFTITIRIRDYAGNYNEQTLPIQIDNEVPWINLTSITATRLYLKIPKPGFRSYLITKPEVEIILAAQYALIEGMIKKGIEGFDTQSFETTVFDEEFGTNRTTKFFRATNAQDVYEIVSSAGGGMGRYYNDIFRANLFVPGPDEEETLNNLRFMVLDTANNLLDTYLGMLRDMKRPDEPIITIS